MSRDVIGDFLAIIRNGIKVSQPSVETDYSKVRHAVANILKAEGFISDVIVDEADGIKKKIKLVLKYVNGESVIHELTRASTPGRRIYTGAGHIKPVIGGLGVSIVSTNKGIMTNKQAQKMSVGGELMCTVW